MFKKKPAKPEQGFTIIEVLIAILIALVFVTVAMQMVVIATMFRVRAQESAEATTWIQEDLEDIKYQAANYQSALLVDEASGDGTHESTDTVLHLSSVEGFQAGDTVIVGTDSTNNTIATGGVDTTAKTITLTAPLGTDWSTDTQVTVTTKCNAASADVGFAEGFRDKITGSSVSGIHNYDNPPSSGNSNTAGTALTSKVFTGRTYRLRRTTTIPANVSDAPYNKLQINYDVSSTSGGSSIASFYTEVLPNATFQCPN
ncbi:prepilin-type N-terminal cleavage/methylation domain-containing protein [Chroococcidiopsidales cyanobacterium LEGE 13417]|nr:prepilin-type N-terminal cleavage/methylation domain-containing protein [Chroococcidiopsidales cyanobacterium LEGE 13417]